MFHCFIGERYPNKGQRKKQNSSITIAVSKKCRTEQEQIRTNVEQTRCIRMHVEQRFLLMFSELATKPLACQPSCSHGKSRQHISNSRRHAHEIERYQFKMSLTFVRKKNSHEKLKTFEIIAAVGIHLRHKETYTDLCSPLATTCCSK